MHPFPIIDLTYYSIHCEARRAMLSNLVMEGHEFAMQFSHIEPLPFSAFPKIKLPPLQFKTVTLLMICFLPGVRFAPEHGYK